MNNAYLVALEIDKVEQGEVFDGGIPMHSTAMHWFTSNESAERVIEVVSGVLTQEEPITLIGGQEDLFGPNKTTPVNVIKNRESSDELHKNLYQKLGTIPVEHVAPYWTLDGYNPHVSAVDGVRFEEDQEFTADRAYIIAAETPAYNPKVVLAHFSLAHINE